MKICIGKYQKKPLQQRFFLVTDFIGYFIQAGLQDAMEPPKCSCMYENCLMPFSLT